MNMKKMFAAMALIMTLVMLAGCATVAPTTAPTAEPTTAPTEAATEAPTTAAEATPAAESALDAIKAKGELVVATNAEYPPFEMMEGEKYVGIDMEVAQIIADKLGVKLKIDNMSFDAVLAAIPVGKCDLGMSSLSITDERSQVMDFSDPYMTTSIKMLVLKDSPIKTYDDLTGKKLGVQLGTLADTAVATWVEGATVSRMTKDSDAVMDLINGKVDAVLTDAAPAKALADMNADKIVLIDEPLSNDKLAIASKKGNTELIQFVNQVLKEIMEDGTFDAIVAKYIPKNQ